jgi:FtsP/CotA-like multicopper oxidase with cupredoxin domain
VQEVNGVAVSDPHQLGPWINAQSGRPVRVKFTNRLPTGAQGDLFLPVDTTIMGAGTAADGTKFTQNRGSIHLHGGLPAWTSDGTPHQWITPAGENTTNKKGVNAVGASDMDVPADGSMTFFWPNGHSGRMLWYHDHTYGMTRLNVYAGEVAGYLVQDPDERALTAGMPEIPLVIADKTFVPDRATLDAKDPLWDSTKWGGLGNLWFPHVYEPFQLWGTTPPAAGFDSASAGTNPAGRWDYAVNDLDGTYLPPKVGATRLDPDYGMVAFPDGSNADGTAGKGPSIRNSVYVLRYFRRQRIYVLFRGFAHR